MKKTAFALLLVLTVFLSGCRWMDGSYIFVSDHREQDTLINQRTAVASSYPQLRTVLENMIRSGVENTVIDVSGYDQKLVTNEIKTAVQYARHIYALGAYAVEEIRYEIGTNAGKPAIAVSISFLKSRNEIQKVRTVTSMEAASIAIGSALNACEPGVVLLVERYSQFDLEQFVDDYARNNPQYVMEIPQVAVSVYPDSGTSRVLEITFSYENSRDNLRMMQNQVAPVFASASLYVSVSGSDFQKYSQLYVFLMERFDYEIVTSITPAYSLLCHGVGDQRAFATVFAAMCSRAGLECQVVTGTRDGKPWCWNIVKMEENYLHVDLIRCSQTGGFRQCSDEEMIGYVWDYSAYPVCSYPEPAAATEPTEETVGK